MRLCMLTIYLNILEHHGEKEKILNCCCDTINKFKTSIVNKQKQLMTQILINNTNQIKVCTYLECMDKKINKLLEFDKKHELQHCHLLIYYQLMT